MALKPFRTTSLAIGLLLTPLYCFGEGLIIDTRLDPRGPKYYVGIAAYPSGGNSLTGHSFIVYGEEDPNAKTSSFRAVGLYAWPEVNTVSALKVLRLGTIPGAIFDESAKAKVSGRLPAYDKISAYVTVIVDEWKYRYATHYLPVWAEDDTPREYSGAEMVDTYHLFEHDCVTFATEQMEKVGLVFPERSVVQNFSLWLPEAYVKWAEQNAIVKGTYSGPLGQYVGEMFDGRPLGQGEWNYADGSRYKGRNVHGFRSGNGVYLINGAEIKGEFILNSIVSGKITLKDGTTFEGIFDENRPSRGSLISPGGFEYQGTFLEGLPLEGTVRFQEGDGFTGSFRNGRPAHGRYTFPSGEFFDGDIAYVNDKPQYLYGTYRLSNGKVFEGYFKDNHTYFGILRDTNGYTFRGWMRDDRAAEGNWYYPSGQFERQADRNGATIPLAHELPLPPLSAPPPTPPQTFNGRQPAPDLPAPTGAPALPNPQLPTPPPVQIPIPNPPWIPAPPRPPVLTPPFPIIRG